MEITRVDKIIGAILIVLLVITLIALSCAGVIGGNAGLSGS